MLITGGGSSIGLATARRLVAAGATVVLAGRRSETIDSAATELDPTGARAVAISTDVSEVDHLDRLAGEIEKRFGRLGCVDDVADAVTFLPSPRTAHLTGQDLGVDGGLATTVR